MANKFKEIEPEVEEQVAFDEVVSTPETESKESKPFKRSGLIKSLSTLFGGGFLGNERVMKLIPFILFLLLVTLGYIANGYYAENKIRQVNKITNELKELRSEYISSSSQLMFLSKQSEVAHAVEKLGLKESIVPPTIIEIKNTDTTKVNEQR